VPPAVKEFFEQALSLDEKDFLRVEKTHKVDEGETVPRGAKVTVHYTGKLTNGEVFDSSVSRGKPFEFVVGTG
jgi:FKBP-type peptidyl-prolyl cis-trans isomerase